jgi:hypothetical protein
MTKTLNHIIFFFLHPDRQERDFDNSANIPLTSSGNEMIFTEKIEKELI